MADSDTTPARRYWLMKAEPESRIVKGKDVAFSVDHFETLGVSPWDGVRNAQAKNFMKNDMKVGDGILFYHSNCKEPGVAALAEVAKEGYVDHTAFDETHPYYDAKSDKDNPKWFMVDVAFQERLPHLVSLKLLQSIAALSALPEPLSYLSDSMLSGIKDMTLIKRGRLSVQPVEPIVYEAVKLLGIKGGWEDWLEEEKIKEKKAKKVAKTNKRKKSDQGESEEAAGSKEEKN
ncbi:DUF55-domain-containing protein [Atractiella rhizophila]|nr:DUF55-domain-containing protein [Atractiella rhizophila]